MRKQPNADRCLTDDEVQEQLGKMIRADLIPHLHDQIVHCLGDIYCAQGRDAFEKFAERILHDVATTASGVLGRYRLDQMLSRVEAVQDTIEMRDAAAVPKWRSP